MHVHKLQEIEQTSSEDEFVIPPCPVCGAEDSLKPDVVLFGDSVPRKVVDAVNAMVEQADSCIVVGTSLSTFSSFRIVKVWRWGGEEEEEEEEKKQYPQPRTIELMILLTMI